MIDETTDVSKKEQVSLCLRYADDKTGKIEERLVQMLPVDKADASSLENLEMKFIEKHTIALQNCVGQCYDGASVMQGQYNGLQAKIKAMVPHAISTWCYGHRLQLAIEAASNDVRAVLNAFGVLNSIYVFFHGSGKRNSIWVKTLKDFSITFPNLDYDGSACGIKSWQSLSVTRWFARTYNLKAFCTNFHPLIITLTECDDGENLLHAISRFSIVATIYLIYPAFTLLEAASVALQTKSEDIGGSCDIIFSLKENLIQLRDYDQRGVFDASVRKATLDCQAHEIEIALPRGRRRPVRFQGNGNGAGLQADAADEYDNISDQLKKTVWTPFLVSVLQKLDDRFTPATLALGQAISALTDMSAPENPNIERDYLRKYPTILCEDIPLMFAERQLLFQSIRIKNTAETVDFISGKLRLILKEAFPLRNAYPNIYRALAIAATITYTKSSCERSFSKLDLLKKKIRSTMSDGRLNSLMIGYCERDVVQSLVLHDLDSLVTLFSGLVEGKQRRINYQHVIMRF